LRRRFRPVSASCRFRVWGLHASAAHESTQAEGALLAFDDLFEKGRTIDFQDLPERQWATTGQTLQNLDVYKEFGRLRCDSALCRARG
jgi:hypothetical protein